MGEVYALLSAASFGIAGAAVAKGAPTAKGDNGVFLSIVLTLALSGLLWLAFGNDPGTIDSATALWAGIGFFVVAGVLATVFGRLTNFRSIAMSGAIRSSVFRRLIPVFSIALAFLLLGERYPPTAMVGMLLILGSIGLAMWVRAPRAVGGPPDLSKNDLRLGLIFGTVSAFCYALAYIARKLAMQYLPDAALGALVGAITGVVWYVLASCVSARYRDSLFCVFRTAGPWQWLGALGMSLGQILLFFALISAPVAVVAIIGSLEMFVGAYLAAFLFQSEPVPGRGMILATILAAVGVALVAVS
ncbi:DMT family transporter [Roseivivax sp. THAF30]|uniref:DMT family transporter n=1 Tax=Roseivivax sp. THAF30 TaxID=2587852 RepID=UPI0015622598|nr:DMT family transporter [Roseivivax sp. THAF30]